MIPGKFEDDKLPVLRNAFEGSLNRVFESLNI